MTNGSDEIAWDLEKVTFGEYRRLSRLDLTNADDRAFFDGVLDRALVARRGSSQLRDLGDVLRHLLATLEAAVQNTDDAPDQPTGNGGAGEHE